MQPKQSAGISFQARLQEFSAEARKITSEFEDLLNAEKPPELIYHYTDWRGLQGILKSGELWLSDIFSLNDPSELRYGVDIGLERIKEIAAYPVHNKRSTIGQEFVRDAAANVETLAHFFTCSFSKNRSEIGQWRAYADDGHGYALGFNASQLENAFGQDFQAPIGRSSFSLMYDEAKLKSGIDRLAESARKLIASTEPIGSEDMFPSNDVVSGLAEMLNHIVTLGLMFKHQAYKAEDEYRFLEMHPEGEAAADVRERPYSIIPYRKFNWVNRARAALQEIVVGPAVDFRMGASFAHQCLRTYWTEPASVNISPSGVPYRSSRRT